MKYYLAAPYNRRDEARRVRAALAEKGYVCTARWIDNHLPSESDADNAMRRHEARQDLADIVDSHLVIVLNDRNYPSTSGGLHLEMGYALALRLPVLLIGEPTSIFHIDLPCYAKVDDVPTAA